MRKYEVKASMFIDGFTQEIVQPDAALVAQFHTLLNMIPDENVALGIDYTVAQILRFRNPNKQTLTEILLPEEGATNEK